MKKLEQLKKQLARIESLQQGTHPFLPAYQKMEQEIENLKIQILLLESIKQNTR